MKRERGRKWEGERDRAMKIEREGGGSGGREIE